MSAWSYRLLVMVPSIDTVPVVGTSMQPIMLRMVVLPLPDGPAIAVNSPFPIEMDTASIARTDSLPSG